jgi:hypothetical protein
MTSALQSTMPHASDCGRGAVDTVGRLASARRTLTESAFFLKGQIQAFREPAKREGGTPERDIFLGQPCEFLATTRTVISHKHSPFRSSRTFERDDIHTGHNEMQPETVPENADPSPRPPTPKAPARPR